VLRYADPFASQVADSVWGQDDFAGHECNKGHWPPDCRTLCLEYFRHAAVAIDDGGNLWVTDRGNQRVLRFPKCPLPGPPACNGVPPGHIGPEADVVLGQPDCASYDGGDLPARNRFDLPVDVAFDKRTRALYVVDTAMPEEWNAETRIVRF